MNRSAKGTVVTSICAPVKASKSGPRRRSGSVTAGRQWVTRSRSIGLGLQAESETRFFGVGEATYIFVKDEKGQVKEMIYDVGFFKLTARKIK